MKRKKKPEAKAKMRNRPSEDLDQAAFGSVQETIKQSGEGGHQRRSGD